MVPTFRHELERMYLFTTTTQYMMAWAATTAYYQHKDQVYASPYGDQPYAVAHLEAVCNSAYKQAKFDRKLHKAAKNLGGFAPNELVMLIVCVSLLHDLKEDTPVKSFSDLINNFEMFSTFEHYASLPISDHFVDNDIYGTPPNFHEEQKALQLQGKSYLPIINQALELLTKKEGMDYENYRTMLFGFKPETPKQRLAWIIALVVKLHDSLINAQSCFTSGDLKWSKKYLQNQSDITDILTNNQTYSG